MDAILRRVSRGGLVLLVAVLALAMPGLALAGDDGVVGYPPLPRAVPLSRATMQTVGHPRPALRTRQAPAADSTSDEFDSLPLGDGAPMGHPPRAAVRSTEAATAQMMRDCEQAERGDPAAAYRVGRRFLFGVGVARDKRMGVAWMRAAASRGFGPAIQVAMLVPRNIGRMRPWCRPSVEPSHRLAAPPAEIVKLVSTLAPDYGLDPNLVLAVIEIESAFHTNAVSPKDAAGLMQLIPDTAERFGVHNVFDPVDNLRGGMKYLRWLLAYFEGDVTLALAGYNAGERAVDRYGGVPPYAETQAYVRLIHGLYPPTQHRFDAGVTEPSSRFSRQTADAAR